MKGFVGNIEQETLKNTDYRRVLYTVHDMQLVVMSLAPGVEIGEEVHELAQFIRIEAGTATVHMGEAVHALSADDAVIIPAGMRHNVVNTGKNDCKLYSIYAPPEHRHDVIHSTKADEREEHFDGVVSE